MSRTILLLGEFDPNFPPHAATNAAFDHAANASSTSLNCRWISTVDCNVATVQKAKGLWIAPGSPYKDFAKTLTAIRTARENNIPCLGTCGGFQHMILEYARNVLHFSEAQHAEYDPYASQLFISRLACSLVGRSMELTFTADSQVAQAYGSLTATEEYYCNFGVNPEFLPLLQKGPLRFTGRDREGEARVIEWPSLSFYVGTLYVPQMRSQPSLPHPLIVAFVRAVLRTATSSA